MAVENRQIKSKERVRAHGEVFTAPREVNAMLDLVKDETERLDATFLEPACGDGNFLDEVLRRKLAVCRRRYGRSATDYEKFSFLACTTLYGVDILADNVARCRERTRTRPRQNPIRPWQAPCRRATTRRWRGRCVSSLSETFCLAMPSR